MKTAKQVYEEQVEKKKRREEQGFIDECKRIEQSIETAVACDGFDCLIPKNLLPRTLAHVLSLGYKVETSEYPCSDKLSWDQSVNKEVE